MHLTYILHKDVVGARLDSNAVIAALIDNIGKFNIIRIHSVESIGVLNPVLAEWCIDRCSIIVDVVEPHICAVHDVEGPER